MVQLSHPCMTTGKTIALTVWTFIVKEMSLLFNTLARFVIAFLPRSKHFWISWQQSLSTLILEPKKIKSVTASTFSHIYAMKWWNRMPWSLYFECWVLNQLFHSPLSSSSRDSLVPLHFLPFEWYHLHIWGCWYFSWQSWFQLVSHPAYHFTFHSYLKIPFSQSEVFDISPSNLDSSLCFIQPGILHDVLHM